MKGGKHDRTDFGDEFFCQVLVGIASLILIAY